mgnify:CR=1 FL=1
MASNTFSVNNGTVTTGTKTFTLQGQDLSQASYIDTTSNSVEPRVAVVSCDTKPVGQKGNNRAGVSFKRTKLDVNGVAQTLSCTISFSIPKTVLFTDAEIVDVGVNATSYLTEARILALMDGVMP